MIGSYLGNEIMKDAVGFFPWRHHAQAGYLAPGVYLEVMGLLVQFKIISEGISSHREKTPVNLAQD